MNSSCEESTSTVDSESGERKKKRKKVETRVRKEDDKEIKDWKRKRR